MSEEKTSGAQISLFGFDQAGDTSSESPKSKSKNLDITPSKVYANLDELKQEASVCQKMQLSQNPYQCGDRTGRSQGFNYDYWGSSRESEDETGLPFVGRSGQLLDKILTSVQFDLNQDVYVCNINKCRPPENRVPTEEEVAACKPYLLEQIRLVDPKIILLTGATAVKAITGDKRGITKIRGQWSQWDGRWIMPIFHPAYLLRMASREEGSPKWLMWQDIKAIKEKYLEIKSEIKGEIAES